MKRIALDTDAVNRLADTPGLVTAAQRAHERGALTFVVNHVVHDQLAATPARDDDASPDDLAKACLRGAHGAGSPYFARTHRASDHVP